MGVCVHTRTPRAFNSQGLARARDLPSMLSSPPRPLSEPRRSLRWARVILATPFGDPGFLTSVISDCRFDLLCGFILVVLLRLNRIDDFVVNRSRFAELRRHRGIRHRRNPMQDVAGSQLSLSVAPTFGPQSGQRVADRRHFLIEAYEIDLPTLALPPGQGPSRWKRI